jgi:hypothetical protein
VLITSRGVADERDVGDLDTEEMEVRLLWTPAENSDLVAVTGSGCSVVDGQRATSHLDLPLVLVTRGRDAVHEEPQGENPWTSARSEHAARGTELAAVATGVPSWARAVEPTPTRARGLC